MELDGPDPKYLEPEVGENKLDSVNDLSSKLATGVRLICPAANYCLFPTTV